MTGFTVSLEVLNPPAVSYEVAVGIPESTSRLVYVKIAKLKRLDGAAFEPIPYSEICLEDRDRELLADYVGTLNLPVLLAGAPRVLGGPLCHLRFTVDGATVGVKWSGLPSRALDAIVPVAGSRGRTTATSDWAWTCSARSAPRGRYRKKRPPRNRR